MRGRKYVGRVSYSPKSFVQGVKVKAERLFSVLFGVAVITGLFAVFSIISIFGAIFFGLRVCVLCVVGLAVFIRFCVCVVRILIVFFVFGGGLCCGFRVENGFIGWEFGNVGGFAVFGDLVFAATGEGIRRGQEELSSFGDGHQFAYVSVRVFDASALLGAFRGGFTRFDGGAAQAWVAVYFVHLS